MKTMGARIHQKRVEYGYTMEELGKKVGVNKSAVNKWEKAKVKNIQRSHIFKLAEIFHTTPQWIMGLDDSTDVLLTYTAEGKEAVELKVDKEPIIGETSLRAKLLQAAVDVSPENLTIAINLLNALKNKKEEGEQ